jgi:hypothetical protein
MTTFPALKPSGRTFTPGDYPNTPFKAWDGNEGRVRHSNVMLESTLRLTFTGINEAQMLSILTHYQGQRGNFESFVLPDDVWSGVSTVSDYSLTSYRWCYIEPPTVSDLPCGNHIVELSLATVPPEGVNLNGLTSLVALLISGGNVTVSDGLTKTITWSFAPGLGDAPVNADGITATITASIAGGSVEIIPAGITATVTASLQPGQFAISDGLTEAVTLSLQPGAATGASGDPNFANVSLLLHMDGSNGSTTFTDSSNNGHTITVFGNTQISTAQSKFGGASALFDGTGDYLRPPATSTLAFGTGDFTIEFWVRWVNVTGAQAPFSYGNTIISLIKNASHTATFIINNVSSSGTTVLSTGAWYHMAMCRAGGSFRFFLNGTQEGSTLSNTTNFTSNQPFIGRRSDNSFPYYLNGYIDDLRITKGVARYTSNFTIPSEAFPDS